MLGGRPAGVVARAGFSLRRRLQFLVGGLVVVLVAGGLTTLLLIRDTQATLDLIVFRLEPALESARLFHLAITDQKTAVAGFVQTHTEETLEPLQRGKDRSAEATKQLREHLGALPERQLLDEAVERLDAWDADIVEPLISSVRAARYSEAQGLLATGERQFQDEVDGAAQRLRLALERRLEANRGRFAAARRGITQSVVVILAVGALLIIVVTIALRRWVLTPLAALQASVGEVAGGAIYHEIEGVGPDELADLGADVEAMRKRIIDELVQAQRAEQGLEQEAPVVAAIRKVLAPDVAPLLGWTVAIHVEPAVGVLAGDWYEVSPLAGGRLGVCIGDVAGHGAEAGLVALRSKDLVLASMRMGLGPAESIQLVADELVLGDESFLTLFCGVIEADGTLRFANGGHSPPLLATADAVSLLHPTGPLLGALEGTWREGRATVGSGTTLVLYTDGVTEATDSHGDEYGLERLESCVAESAREGAAGIVASYVGQMRAGEGMPRDDITLVAVTRTA